MHVGWKQLLKSLKSFVTLNFCGTFLYIWIRWVFTNILIYFSPKLYGVNLSYSIRHFNFPEGDIWIKMRYNDLKHIYIYICISVIIKTEIWALCHSLGLLYGTMMHIVYFTFFVLRYSLLLPIFLHSRYTCKICTSICYPLIFNI